MLQNETPYAILSVGIAEFTACIGFNAGAGGLLKECAMSPEVLAGAAGIVLSLAFSYIPGLSGWYQKQDAVIKRLIMLAMLMVVAGAVFGLSCAGWFGMATYVACTQAGVETLVKAFILAMVANQAAYAISPLPTKPQAEPVQ